MAAYFSTTFLRLFSDLGIHAIEIPKIQRDYAQGRSDADATRVRRDFLKVLHGAVTDSSRTCDLDFIYGSVVCKEGRTRVFRPLDGQQRLTTLFLLHWVLAVRAGREPRRKRGQWTSFSYETRESSRQFFEKLVENSPQLKDLDDTVTLDRWLVDQSWFRHGWHGDPTASGALTMIREVDETFTSTVGGRDRLTAQEASLYWSRLEEPAIEGAAISFSVLPLSDRPGDALSQRADDEIYIKMNSRGRMLTEFENSKARLGGLLHDVAGAEQFGSKIDDEWMQLFWTRPVKTPNGSNIEWTECADASDLDARLLRYMVHVLQFHHYLAKPAVEPSHEFDELVDTLFGDGAEGRPAAYDSLRRALDVWHDSDHWFESYFWSARDDQSGVDSAGRINLFGGVTNLLRAVSEPDPSIAERLMLHAAMYVRDLDPEMADNTYRVRLRILRNLLHHERADLRKENFPALIEGAQKLICEGPESLSSPPYPQESVEEELAKQRIRARHPDLHALMDKLDDHDLLRGSVGILLPDGMITGDDDAQTRRNFERRATAFLRLFRTSEELLPIARAWLACGDYSLRARHREFGSEKWGPAWRRIMAAGRRDDRSRSREALAMLLDVTDGDSSCLAECTRSYLEQCEKKRRLDWRYYFVKYEEMMKHGSGIYSWDLQDSGIADGFMIRRLTKTSLNSYHQDPYLETIRARSDHSDDLDPTDRTGSMRDRVSALKAPSLGLTITLSRDGCLSFAQGQDGSARELMGIIEKCERFDTEDRITAGIAYINDIFKNAEGGGQNGA